jgi:uncharacterized protein YaeQ
VSLKATVCKVQLDIANIDAGYYQKHQLTLAQHPSETAERLMLRILAFALHAHPQLTFGKDIGDTGEPALWQKNQTGEIVLWIELGAPDERTLRKACSRAQQVVLIMYGRRSSADQWWEKNADDLKSKTNLTISYLGQKSTQAMAAFAARSMEIACTIQDRQITLSDGKNTVTLELIDFQKKN